MCIAVGVVVLGRRLGLRVDETGLMPVLEGGGQLVGVGGHALGLQGEMVFGPFGEPLGDRVGLAGEARRARAVGDERGQAEVVGEVQRLVGRDPQAGAGVVVVADRGGVDAHRRARDLLGFAGVAEAEHEPRLQQVEHALEDLVLVL
jgi:hypothetical protein